MQVEPLLRACFCLFVAFEQQAVLLGITPLPLLWALVLHLYQAGVVEEALHLYQVEVAQEVPLL